MSHALTQLFLAQHASGSVIENFDESLTPADRPIAYAIQSAVVAELGGIGAWKVQPYPADNEPLASPIPSTFVFSASENIALSGARNLMVEAEVAVTLATDLPSIGRAYTPDDLRQAIGSTQLAIEILNSRFASLKDAPALAAVADLQSNGAVIVGTPRNFADLPELGNLDMDLLVDGVSIGAVTTGPTTETTLRSLAWLANHAISRGTPLAAGTVIITGARIGALPLEGKTIEINAPGFASIIATLA